MARLPVEVTLMHCVPSSVLICWFDPVNIAELASLFSTTEPVFQEFAAFAVVPLNAE